ncbi:hypothetical protein ACRRTK_003927 [Alexandromys fortis]
MCVSSKQSLISNNTEKFLTVLEPGKHKITVPEFVIWWEIASEFFIFERKQNAPASDTA